MVRIHLHPSQLYIKSTWLRLFSYKTYSMRIAPASVFALHDNSAAGTPSPSPSSSFTLDDRCGTTPVRFSSPHRDIIFATYCRFLRNRIGGSDSFDEKQSLFFERLQAEHAGSSGSGSSAACHFGVRTAKELQLNRLPDAEFVEEVFQRTKRLNDAECLHLLLAPQFSLEGGIAPHGAGAL